MFAVKFQLSAAVAAVAALTALHGVAIAETAAEVPKDAYYAEVLTPAERAGIAEEENVSPNDGRMSVPPSQDQNLIPDAGDGAANSEPTETQQQNLQEDVRSGTKGSGNNEAQEILKESRDQYKVTKKDISGCMKDWSPQTQMTKEEWAASCRTTLEYFPDGK